MNTSPNYVFQHGGTQGGWIWAETIEAMKTQSGGSLGQLLALDVPGCGTKRGRNTEGVTIADVAREQVADIEAAGLRDVILVGHSQGGQLLPLMAAMKPALFRRVVYLTCLGQIPGKNILQMYGNGLNGTVEDEIGFPADPATTSPSARMKIMFCNDMDKEQTTAFFSRLGPDNWPPLTYAEQDWGHKHPGTVPSTYIICLQDLAIPVPWQETFAKQAGVEKRVYIDAGHQVMNTRPHALAEILRHEGE
jgi:pimeloyl-ACP methyl ester carboxylesterase